MSEFDNINVSIKKKQGDLGEARAVYEYTKLGYTVSVPLSDSDKYDLIIDNGISLLKVQVKTSCHRSSKKRDSTTGRIRYGVQLSTTGSNTKGHQSRIRQKYDYDILFVMVENGQCWSIPVDELGQTGHQITVDLTDKCKFNKFKIT